MDHDLCTLRLLSMSGYKIHRKSPYYWKFGKIRLKISLNYSVCDYDLRISNFISLFMFREWPFPNFITIFTKIYKNWQFRDNFPIFEWKFSLSILTHSADFHTEKRILECKIGDDESIGWNYLLNFELSPRPVAKCVQTALHFNGYYRQRKMANFHVFDPWNEPLLLFDSFFGL